MRRIPPVLLPAMLLALWSDMQSGARTGVAPAAAEAVCPDEQHGYQRLASADAEIAFRWEPAEVKAGQFFAADVVVCRAPGSEPVAAVGVAATMPAHGHGMSYRPRSESTEAGGHRVTGLMLHMPGMWQITFDLLQGGRHTRLTHEVSLKP